MTSDASGMDGVKPNLTISEEEGGPYQLTVASTGGAEEFWYRSLGVYSKTGERHNNKTVWARHHGNKKIFFNECEIYQMNRNNNSNAMIYRREMGDRRP